MLKPDLNFISKPLQNTEISVSSKKLMIACLALILLVFTDVEQLFAQSRPLNVTGGVTMSARAYQVSGIDGRRAPLSATTNGNLQFDLFGLKTGLNLTYTTEESRLRQSVNRLSFDTSWSWGSFSAGDVSPDLGRFMLQGSTVRGGFTRGNVGNWMYDFTTGQSRKAVGFNADLPFTSTSFQRMLYAGRIGYGDQNANHLKIGSMYARDVAGSINDPGSETPSENLVITTEGGLHLFENRLKINAQLSTSALNRDFRNPVASESSLPGIMNSLFNAREGHSFNLAGEGQLRIELPSFTLNSQYSRIDPGYESLGLRNVINDQESFSIQPVFQLFDRRLSVSMNYQYGRNNLDNQRQSTLSRTQMGINLTGRATENITITAGYNRMGNLNKPVSDLVNPIQIQLDYLMHSLMFAPSVVIQQGDFSHSITLSGAYQFSDDRSLAVQEGIRPGRDQDIYTSNLAYMLRFPSGFSINTSGNFVRSDTNNSLTTSYGINAGSGIQFLENKLNLNINLGWAANSTEFSSRDLDVKRAAEQFIASTALSYRITGKTSLRLQSRGLVNRMKQGDGQAFREFQTEVFLSHKF